jgi:hypothetical protein
MVVSSACISVAMIAHAVMAARLPPANALSVLPDITSPGGRTTT